MSAANPASTNFTHGSSSSFTSRWVARDVEAQMLAELLRTSRVTLLYGAPGCGKTTLLTDGVLRLLARRTLDRQPETPGAGRIVIPFPDRRPARDAPAAEVAVLFDAWGAAPAAALKARLQAALPAFRSPSSSPSPSASASAPSSLVSMLRAWRTERNVRFLVILDSFEQYLAKPEDDDDVRAFADEFAAAVNDPVAGANFLICLRDYAEPAAARLRSRIAQFGDARLRLRALPGQQVNAPADAAHGEIEQAQPAKAAASAPVAETSASAETTQRDMRLIEASARVAIAALEAPNNDAPAEPSPPQQIVAQASPPAQQAERLPADVKAIDSVSEAMPKDLVMPPAAAASVRSRRWKWLPVPLLTVIAVLGAFIVAQNGRLELPLTNLTFFAAPGVKKPVPPPALPKIALLLDPGDSTDRRIARDLSRIANASGRMQLVTRSDVPFWQRDPAAHISIVRYEALELAHRRKLAGDAAVDDVAIIAPLYTEEILLLAARGSPMSSIDDIRDARINVGPTQGSRGVTAERLYRAMFGEPLPQGKVTAYNDDEAMLRMLKGDIDVMMVVGAQPTQWLRSMSPELAASIKLLKLDRLRPAGAQATEVYLPVTVRANLYGSWPVEDTPTLATLAFLATSDSSDPVVAQRVAAFIEAWCRDLPNLRRVGHAKWREVQPGLTLDTGWPDSTVAKAALASCAVDDDKQAESKADKQASNAYHTP